MRGGARPGSGPKKRPKLKVGLHQDVAADLLATVKEKQAWLALYEHAELKDKSLQFAILRYWKDCRDGKPTFRMAAHVTGLEGLAEKIEQARSRAKQT